MDTLPPMNTLYNESAERANDRNREDKAIFGGGCFWCLEAAFDNIPGVIEVTPGYAGGRTVNPTYEEVCAGMTGHAEVVRIVYDPDVITYSQLLDVFWRIHDPTQLNRQGADVGTQYRSIIIVTDDNQLKEAKDAVTALEAKGDISSPIVTSIEPVTEFYPAEQEHRNYYRRNPDKAYCRLVIAPKLRKLYSDK